MRGAAPRPVQLPAMGAPTYDLRRFAAKHQISAALHASFHAGSLKTHRLSLPMHLSVGPFYLRSHTAVPAAASYVQTRDPASAPTRVDILGRSPHVSRSSSGADETEYAAPTQVLCNWREASCLFEQEPMQAVLAWCCSRFILPTSRLFGLPPFHSWNVSTVEQVPNFLIAK